MYMYRKPFTAGTYESMELWGVDYKIVLVIAQVLGYALSKFAGIRIISELDYTRRIRLFLLLIAFAWLALVGFAFLPPAWGPVMLFINGMPLGLIWGIVFTFCEGRHFTEILTVFISANFILTSGIAKSLGRVLVLNGVSEQMMPMVIGACMFPLLGISLWMLSLIPPPSEEEKEYKSERKAMSKNDKKQFLAKYGMATLLFVLFYLMLTIIRDIRDNFNVEIWDSLGFAENPEIYTTTELPVTILVLIGLAFLYRIKDNFKALKINLNICILGISLLLVSTVLFRMQFISPVIWMMSTGVGLFLPYILLNGVVFDRFIASYAITANVGFIMYISDAFGYLGSIVIMLVKNLMSLNLNWLNFFQMLCLIAGSAGLIVVLLLKWRIAHKTS